jgi:hypothetical protein
MEDSQEELKKPLPLLLHHSSESSSTYENPSIASKNLISPASSTTVGSTGSSPRSLTAEKNSDISRESSPKHGNKLPQLSEGDQEMESLTQECRAYYNKALDLHISDHPYFPLIFELYSKAAELGHPKAAYILGCLYKGPEGEYNDEQAIHWLTLAIEKAPEIYGGKKYVQAMDALGGLLINRSKNMDDIESRKEAILWFQKIEETSEEDSILWDNFNVGEGSENKRLAEKSKRHSERSKQRRQKMIQEYSSLTSDQNNQTHLEINTDSKMHE